VAAGRSAASGALNISTGRETPVLEIAEGLGLDVEFEPRRRGEIGRSCLDPARARRSLGWHARTALRTGLDRLRVPVPMAPA
jgi:UDP-glucose 4-epimerase